MRLFRKLRQMWIDHKAMEAIRGNRGDVYIVSCCSALNNNFDVYTFQAVDSRVNHEDPAKAILTSFDTIYTWIGTSTKSMHLTEKSK